MHFAATGKSGRGYAYEARLRPWLWYASLRTDCKVFQHLTVPQIVKAVLSRYPYPIQNKLSANYREWDYCVQYRESDLNFVSRLMEHEGIYYYFEHSKGEHTLVLCDDIGAHAPFPEYATIPFNGPESSLMEEELLHGYLLRYGTVRVAMPCHAFSLTLQAHNLYIRLEDRLIAYHPHHLVHNAVLRRCIVHNGLLLRQFGERDRLVTLHLRGVGLERKLHSLSAVCICSYHGKQHGCCRNKYGYSLFVHLSI